MKTELYPEKQLRPVIDMLLTAQHMIENMVNIESYDFIKMKDTNPKLFRLYMDINECCCEAFDLEDN